MNFPLFKQLETIYTQNAPLHRHQKEAWSRFKTCPMQTRPPWKMPTEISPSSLPHQMPPISYLPECKDSSIVFVNGMYVPHLSKCTSTKMIVLPLEEAWSDYGQMLHKCFSESILLENHFLALLNYALSSHGVFIYVPPQVHVTQPLHFLHIITEDQKNPFLSPQMILFLGRFAQLDTITTLLAPNHLHFWNANMLTAYIDKEAIYSHLDMRHAPSPGLDMSSFRMHLKEKACATWRSFHHGGTDLRYDVQINLNGKQAQTELTSCALIKEKNQGHLGATINHRAEETTSRQLVKHLVDRQGRAHFTGKIFVDRLAQKTEAYQLNHNLLLDKRGSAFSQPNLEILADDVKASHGATMSKMKEELLFYAQTRGLSKQEAKRQLIWAFCRELIEHISIPSLAKQACFAFKYAHEKVGF